ncbi:MAG: HEAT repeat domain-containing protein, partial [Gammaproteobacteria bacterium]
HLAQVEAVEPLRAMVHRGDRLLALHALGALVQVDPAVAAHELAPELILGRDWQPREVVSVLFEARAACAPVLCALLPGTQQENLPRLLQVMEGLRVMPPAAQLAALLDAGAAVHAEVRIAALRCVNDPALRAQVLGLLHHPDWRVRMQAAKALGRVGRPGDEEALAALLSDPEWWVRYRSAQVLSTLPFLDRAQLDRIAHRNTDRFAADILRQVGAEKELA